MDGLLASRGTPSEGLTVIYAHSSFICYLLFVYFIILSCPMEAKRTKNPDPEDE